jgi:hypothetical protein
MTLALLGGLAGLLALVPLSYVAAHLWLNAPAWGEPPISHRFDDGDLAPWGRLMRQLSGPDSLRILDAPGRPGRRAARFALHHDDRDIKGSRRAELRFRAARFGRRYDYGIGVYVPADWQADPVPVTVVQWHNVPDLWRGDGPLPSVLRIEIIGGEWSIDLHWGAGRRWLRPQADLHSRLLWRGPIERCRWTDWRFAITWSRNDDGAIEAWKDGAAIVRYSGPTAYDNTLAPYMKFGIYVPEWKIFPDRAVAVRRRELWFDHASVERDRALTTASVVSAGA